MTARFPRALLAVATSVLLLAASRSGASAAITVKFELEDGAKVSDITTVVAHITTTGATLVQKVEFSVDGEVKSTDTSVPYTFDWDTLSVTEGSHTLIATAYDEKDNKKSATINVTVDNELGKGAEYHADQALARLKENDVEGATRYARRALKIQPDNLKAARALAGIHRQRGELAQALAVMEKARIEDNDVDARADLVALQVAAAAASESTEDFLKGATAAVDMYPKLLTARYAPDRAPAGMTGATQRGDYYFASRQWQNAIDEYMKCGPAEDAPTECVNRLILAQIKMDNLRQAQFLIGVVTRAKHADDATKALQGLLYLHDFQAAKAREIVQDGVEAKALPSLIIAAYADLSLGQRRKAQGEAEQAFAIAPDLPEVRMLHSYFAGDPMEARNDVIRALETDPTMPEGYALRGFQVLITRDKSRFGPADALFDYSLKRDPKSTYALMGSALSLIAQKRGNEAEPVLKQLADLDKNAPDVPVAQALNYSLLDKSYMENALLERANKLDPARWNYTLAPTIGELLLKDYNYRFAPVLTPASLQPGKA